MRANRRASRSDEVLKRDDGAMTGSSVVEDSFS